MGKVDLKSEKTMKIFSYLTFFLLCLSIAAKDCFSINSTINTLPYMSNFVIDITSANIVGASVMVYIFYSLIYGAIVEILSRFVCNSITRVSFNQVYKYRFITIFKLVVITANLVIACFNFMYFNLPFTFKLQPVIEISFLAITFGIIYAICYKKYLNKKSAPVIFMSMALPLSIYFIMVAI